MARTRQTARKKSGPKGVPRHQLAPKNDEASCSNPKPSRKAEIRRLEAELIQASRDRCQDAIQIGELQKQAEKGNRALASCERCLVKVVTDRNDAWEREEIANQHIQQLQFYIGGLEVHQVILHEEVHRLANLLNPDFQREVAAEDLGLVEDNLGPFNEEEQEEPEGPEQEDEPAVQEQMAEPEEMEQVNEAEEDGEEEDPEIVIPASDDEDDGEGVFDDGMDTDPDV
jgi:hypothetical protein